MAYGKLLANAVENGHSHTNKLGLFRCAMDKAQKMIEQHDGEQNGGES